MSLYKVEYLSGTDTFVNKAPEITFNTGGALSYSFYMGDGTTPIRTTGTRWMNTTALGVSGTLNGTTGQVVQLNFSTANLGTFQYQHVVLANFGSQRRIFGYTNIPGNGTSDIASVDRNLFWVPMYTVNSALAGTGNIADTADYMASGIAGIRQNWSLKAEFLTPTPTAGSFTSTITTFVNASGAGPAASATFSTTVTYAVNAFSATLFTNSELLTPFSIFNVGSGRTGYYTVEVTSTDLNAKSLFAKYYGGVSA